MDEHGDLGTATLLISEDLDEVLGLADRIAVMYAGKLVELGPKTDVLAEPSHPYTELLLAAVPSTAKGIRRQRNITPREPHDLANLSSGRLCRDRITPATNNGRSPDFLSAV